MAAVVVAPHRSVHPAPRSIPVPGRPPLQVIPGGRRAARAYAAQQRPANRLHPAIYRRRRLGAALAVLTALAVGYLALTGLQALTAGASAPSAATATASVADGPSDVAYVVQPGDTLWSIARSIKPSGDVRSLVDRLADRVGSGPLVVGQSVPIDGLAG